MGSKARLLQALTGDIGHLAQTLKLPPEAWAGLCYADSHGLDALLETCLARAYHAVDIALGRWFPWVAS